MSTRQWETVYLVSSLDRVINSLTASSGARSAVSSEESGPSTVAVISSWQGSALPYRLRRPGQTARDSLGTVGDQF